MLNPKSDSPKKRSRLAPSTWITGVIALLFLIIGLASGGLPGLLIMAGLIGGITALYVIVTGRQSWAHLPSRKFAALTLAACMVAFIGGAANAGTSNPNSAQLTSAKVNTAPAPRFSPTPSASPTPTPIPTRTVTDFAATDGATAQSALVADGFTVELRATDGTLVPDATGWTVSGQNPAAGTSSAVGSTVILTVTPPAPPPVEVKPAPVAPAPVAPGGGATALCRDGSLSFAAHHQGACSHHGGVATWYK